MWNKSQPLIITVLFNKLGNPVTFKNDHASKIKANKSEALIRILIENHLLEIIISIAIIKIRIHALIIIPMLTNVMNPYIFQYPNEINKTYNIYCLKYMFLPFE